MTMSQAKVAKIFPKVFTIKASTRKLAGNKRFHGVAFRSWGINYRIKNLNMIWKNDFVDFWPPYLPL
jgi:hypothetical protein